MPDWAPDDLWQQERDMWGDPPDDPYEEEEYTDSPSQVEVETAKVRALAALTRATQAMNEANRGLFYATKRRAERRREALAAGASVEEVQEAIKAGHRKENAGGTDR